MDFYTPGLDEVPADLPGCTSWERGEDSDEGACLSQVELLEQPESWQLTRKGPGTVGDKSQMLGVLWTCKALTVPGEPLIRFYASQSSGSNDVSSTRIRRIMCDTSDEDLYWELKEHVLGCELLVEWLQALRERNTKGANQDIYTKS